MNRFAALVRLALSVCLLSALTGCVDTGPEGVLRSFPTATSAPTIGGTTAIPLARVRLAADPPLAALAETLVREYGRVFVQVEVIATAAGAALRDGDADIALAGALPDTRGPVQLTLVGHQPLLLLAHREVAVAGLSSDQVRELFAGRVTDWAAVGAPAGAVSLVALAPHVPSRRDFDQRFLSGDTLAGATRVVSSDRAAVAVVGETAGALGYASLGVVPNNVRVLALDGVMPTAAAVADGRYSLARPVWLATRQNSSTAARELARWAGSEAGRAVAAEWLKGRE